MFYKSKRCSQKLILRNYWSELSESAWTHRPEVQVDLISDLQDHWFQSVSFCEHRTKAETNLETRVNFGRLELILKHPIPPFAIYILNQLDKKLFFWPEMLKENVFHYFINENLGNKQIWTANNAKKKSNLFSQRCRKSSVCSGMTSRIMSRVHLGA